MTEALSLTHADIDWLKQRVPVQLVDEMIKDGEFVIKENDDGNKH